MRLSAPRSLATILAAALLPAAARAQGERHTPIVAEAAGGTRGGTMAGAVVAVRDEEALFYNPAEIVGGGTNAQQPRGASAAWLRSGNATLRGLAAVFQSGRYGIGVSARQLDFEGSALPLSIGGVGASGVRPASSSMLVAGVAREVKGVRVGGAASYGEDRVGDQRAAGSMLDVGVAKTFDRLWLPRGALQFGAAVQHVAGARTVNGVRLQPPTLYTVGANLEGYSIRSFDVSGGVGVSVSREGRIIPRTGWELAWVWIDGYAVQARAGLRRPEFEGQSAVTLGAGFDRENLSLDYAFEPARGVPASHRIGIRVR